MCGVVGYIGANSAVPILLRSLQLVTYRGYDSFGVASLNGHGIESYKSVGTVEDRLQSIPALEGTIGIGHTRWATVGKVSDANAHPHMDCSGRVAVVHNGDIDNFQSLKERLQDAGHRFNSETDSEVLAHLIESHDNGDIVAAIQDAIAEVEGSFAIVALHEPTRSLLVARKESPLVVGYGSEEWFVASDVPALLPYTKQIAYLENGDVALLSPAGVTVWHAGAEVEREVHEIAWDAEQLERGGFPHFMLKEIHEQPEAIRATLKQGAPLAEVKWIPLPLERVDEVVLMGCGTSYHAALIGQQLIERIAPMPVRAGVASELRWPEPRTDSSLVVALTQSGETADTTAAVQEAVAKGYRTLAITNVRGSTITRLVDQVLYTQAGPEVAVAATKTFTTQLVALAMLAGELGRRAQQPLADEMEAGLSRLPIAAETLINGDDALRDVGHYLADYEHLFLIAKGANLPVAMEGALKLKEVAYLHTEGVAAGELKHGPFALLGPETPVIALMGKGQERTRMVNTIKEVQARGSPLIAITSDRDDSELASYAEHVITVPRVSPLVDPVVATVALQLISYHCAAARGCPIDRPRNLAKSVTVR